MTAVRDTLLRHLYLDRFADAVTAVARHDHDQAARALTAIMSRTRTYDGAYEVGDLALVVLAQDGVVRASALALEGPLGTATIDDAAAVTALFLRVLERVSG